MAPDNRERTYEIALQRSGRLSGRRWGTIRCLITSSKLGWTDVCLIERLGC